MFDGMKLTNKEFLDIYVDSMQKAYSKVDEDVKAIYIIISLGNPNDKELINKIINKFITINNYLGGFQFKSSMPEKISKKLKNKSKKLLSTVRIAF